MIKRMIFMLIFVGILFGGIFGFQIFKANMIKKVMAAQGSPPQTVSTTVAEEKEWQPALEAVGSLQASRGADLAPEVGGLVTAIHFKSGQEVKAGTPLLDLNADTDLARLHSLQASAALADKTYQRDRQQFAERAVSQATLDADQAALQSARAQVAEQQALIAKKRIRAPFAGRLGIRAVDLGQYLNAGSKIVTLQSLDPIYLDFFLPQKAVGEVKIGQEVTVGSDAFPDQSFAGKVSAMAPKVDESTRNLQVRARIDNPRHLLLPGMFATARVALGAPQRHVTLPQTAISYNPYGNLVYLVTPANGPQGKQQVAKQSFVTTGATRGDQVAILAGVKPGDVVVTSGQIKLRNGSPVAINNAIQPANNPNPHPKDE